MSRDPHRMWRTLPEVIGNIVVMLVIAAVTVANIAAAEWVFVILGIAVIIGFGVVPAMRAHEAGALYFTRDR